MHTFDIDNGSHTQNHLFWGNSLELHSIFKKKITVIAFDS